MLDKKLVAFPGRLVIVGFGSIGQGVLPLREVVGLLTHAGDAKDPIALCTGAFMLIRGGVHGIPVTPA